MLKWEEFISAVGCGFYQRVALRAPADQWPIWAQFEEGKEG